MGGDGIIGDKDNKIAVYTYNLIAKWEKLIKVVAIEYQSQKKYSSDAAAAAVTSKSVKRKIISSLKFLGFYYPAG